MIVRNYITVVSGMPRSGTSLMMQMLNARGVPALTDNRRAAVATQSNIRTIFVPYAEIIASPQQGAGEVSRFLDGLDTAVMAASGGSATTASIGV